jgi:hypothetical protein
MAEGQTDFELTLRGIVIPITWGTDGAPTGVAILTRDEGEYEVVPGPTSDQLLCHLRREVLARTVPLSGSAGQQRVRVLSFAILEWAGVEDEPPSLNFGDGR